MDFAPEKKRSLKKATRPFGRAVVALLVFGVSVFSVRGLLLSLELSAPWRVVASVVVVAAAFYFLVAIVDALGRYDARQKELQWQAFGVALAATVLALVLGEALRRARVPTWSFTDAWPYAFMTGYVLSYVVGARRYW